MKNFHIKLFIKCGLINNFIISIISNYTKDVCSFEIDYISIYYIIKFRCKSSTINFNNYKFSSCISYENIICHGIPINNIFNYYKIDIAINYYKFHSDNCYINNFLFFKKNFYFKNFFYNILNFIKKNFFYSFFNNFIKYLKKNIFINDIFCSHGIFKKLHNNIIIKHNKNYNIKKIKNFDSFTIEPMFLYNNKNGYNFLKIFFSINNNLTFQWEHTLLIYNNKIFIITLRKNELCCIFH
ncbi:MAG: hypothetical protein ACH6QP_00120 [Candidatus Carsonella ruddii]